MKRKRVLSLLIAIMMIIAMYPGSVYATGTFSIASTESNVPIGETFNVTLTAPAISLSDIEGGMSVKVLFDKAKLELVSRTANIPGCQEVDITSVADANSNGWVIASSSLVTTGISANQEILKMTFKVIGTGSQTFKIDSIEMNDQSGVDTSINYTTSDTTTVNMTLLASSISINENTYTGKTYDGSAIADPTEEQLIKDGSTGAVTFEYFKDNAGVIGDSLGSIAPTIAGKYWVKATVAADSNYASATSDAKSFTIGRAGYTYAGPAVSTTTYVGASYPASEPVTATGVGSETVNGTLSWFTDAEYSTAATGTFDAVGEKTLYWKFTPAAEATNYVTDAKTGSKTFEVGNLPEQVVSFANAGPIEKTYGDAAFTNLATNTTSGGGALSYSSSNESVATVNSTTGEVTIKGAGTVTIKVTAAEVAGNYGKTEKTYTLNVAPKTLQSSDLERADSNAITKVYDGNDNAEGIAYKVKDVSKVNAGDDITITGSAKYNSKDVDTANKIIFTPDPITEGNYALASDETVEIAGAFITARPITVTVNEARRDYLAYNPTFTGTVTGGALAAGDTYAGLGLTFTTTATNASDAGSYDVTKEGCTNTNYNVAVNGTGKLIVDKIEPKASDLTVGITTPQTYDGTVKSATVTAGSGISGLGTITVKYDCSETAPTDANTYAITVDIAEGTNYTAANGLSVGSLEIQKATLTLPSAAATSKTYDGNDTAAITPGALDGVVAADAGKVSVAESSIVGKFASVSVGSNIAVTTSDEFTLTGDKAGNYTLTQPSGLEGTINPCTSVIDQTQTGSAEDPITVVKGVGTFPEAIFGGVNGETATGTVKYSYGSVSNGTWDEVKDSLKSQAADTTGTVSYTFTGTGNYAGASASGSINFKIVDIAFYLEGTETIADAANAVTLADDKTYGKTWDELVTLKSMAAKVGSSPVEGEFSLDVAGIPGAGLKTYNVKFTGGSYADITVFSGSITVEQREVAITWSNYENRVYNDGKTVEAAITNKVEPDDVALSVTGGDETNAGTGYTATAALTGIDAANYKLPAEYTKTYSIAKATPTGTPAYTPITADGKTLKDAALGKGTLNPSAGELKWVDDSDTELLSGTTVEKNKPYRWKFIPTDTNYKAVSGTITPYYVAPAGGGGYLPPVQKPTITSGEGVKVTLSADGTVATIKVDAGYELVDVVLNGVSKGKITEVKGLKTGDKLVVTAAKKAPEPAEPTAEEIIATLADHKLAARSKVVTMKNGKKAVRITWYNRNGEMMEFDGVEIFRSTKRNSGYGKKPIFTSETDKYYNTAVKAGTKYYYKLRGYVVIDGQKYYTDYSLKAIRTVK